MPISISEFELWSDYSDLDNLHVYGNMLKSLYSTVVRGRVSEISRLFDRIRALEDRILTLYIAYVLSRVGFTAKNVVEIDEELRIRELDTTTFGDDDWIAHLDSFENEEEGYRYEWQRLFINSENNIVKTVFVRSLSIIRKLLLDEGLASAYFLVHPRLLRKAKERFKEIKEQTKQAIGKDIVLSTGEFTSKFVPEEDRRKIIEENWEVLRTKILGSFHREWPIVILATNEKQLAQIRERIRKARLTLEMNRDLEEAVKDAGIACEWLLQILHTIYPKKVKERMEFYDLLCDMKEEIIENFGEDVFNDLNLIREWRNNVVHPPITLPSYQIALKIVTKTELFHTLFDENLKEKTYLKS